MSKVTLAQSIKDAHQVWARIAKTGDTKSAAVEYLVHSKRQFHLQYLNPHNAFCSFCWYSYNPNDPNVDFCNQCPAKGMWVAGVPHASCGYTNSPYDSKVMNSGTARERRIVGINMSELIEKVAIKHGVTLQANHE